jgi:hypothetical protein
MSAATADAVISVGTHNGTAFGVVTGFTLSQDGVPLSLKKQGAQLDSAIGFVGKSIVATVTYIAGVTTGYIAIGTTGTLSFTANELSAGGTNSTSCALMKCIGCTKTHQDRSFAIMTATFMVEDDADATSVSG